MNKVRRRLERRAYAAIDREGEALGRLGKIRAYDKERRRKAKRELSSARRGCAEAIERFDAFEAAMGTLRGALECVDIATGELHRPEHVQALIEQVAGRIESLGVGECAKLAKYLRNRAPGLALAQKSVLPRLEALAEPWSAQAVSLACICWYLVRALHNRPARAVSVRCLVISLGPTGLHEPTRRRERIAARGRRGGAAPAPSRLECHRGVQCDTAPLSLRAQGRYPGLSRAVPCPGSIYARGAGDGTREPALTSA